MLQSCHEIIGKYFYILSFTHTIFDIDRKEKTIFNKKKHHKTTCNKNTTVNSTAVLQVSLKPIHKTS